MNTTERYVLDQMVPQLQADGFAVFIQPGRQMLPPFMGTYRPDAIAIGPDKNIAVEVKSDDAGRERKLDDIASLFEGRKDWELRIFYARPVAREADVPRSSAASIAAAASDVRSRIAAGDRRAALLVGWATFEAEGRRHLSPDTVWPQTIPNLLEHLASEGVVTPSEADLLRRLAVARSRLIHGDLEIDVRDGDLTALVDIIDLLRNAEIDPSSDPAVAIQ